MGANASNTADYESFGYDSASNLTTHRRRNGATITYTFDALDRQTKKDVPAYNGLSATSYDVYTAYNIGSQVLSKRLASITGAGVVYTYDGLGRIKTVTDPESRALSYLYNIASARTRMTFPKKTAAGTDADYVTYSVDFAGRSTDATYTSGSTVSPLFSQRFDNLSRRISLTRGAATSNCDNVACGTFYTYDNAGRLTSMDVRLAGTANDIKWIFGTQTGTSPIVAGYNPAGQLTKWNATSTRFDHKQVVADNRNFNGLNQDGTLVGVTAACPVGGYDASGNLICDGARTFTYDAENRLLSAVNSTANRKTVLTYDAEGRLQNKVVTVNSTGAAVSDERYLYDGVNLVAEYNSTGTQLNRYIHGTGPDEPLAWFVGTAITNPRFFVANYQGSVLGYSDAAGNLAEFYTYSPYGEMAVGNVSTGTTAVSWTGAAKFRYTGQVALADTQLYYYKARVYDPAFGRFLQTDPVGSDDDLNLYGYVSGDPINKSDPTGLEGENSEDIGLAIAVFVNEASFKRSLSKTTDLRERIRLADRAAALYIHSGGYPELAYDEERRTRPSTLRNPHTIKFTQSSYSSNYGDKEKRTINGTVAELKAGKNPASIPPIRVFVDEGGVVRTLDHRRLIAAQRAGTLVNTIELTLDEARALPGSAGRRARNGRFDVIAPESDGRTRRRTRK